MAKKEKLVITGNARVDAQRASSSAKESAAMRSLRIDGSSNGATLRTRVIRNKKLYNRNFKHKKSFADAGDSVFLCSCHEIFPQFVNNTR
ncbi:MAG: hypothetical protein MJY87_03130 [Fibrobacter sp.]|nr:hypothetical protein [Fibrobacter sp.]